MTPIAYMPDGKPAPYVLTAKEAATFLRITAKDAQAALRTLRKKGLKGIMLSGRILFPLSELMRFVDQQFKDNSK